MTKPHLQWLRHGIQTSVIVAILAIPLGIQYGEYLYNRNLDRFLDEWPASFQRGSLRAIHDALRATAPSADRDQILQKLQSVRGNHWSAQILGISLTDPLAGIGSICASGAVTKTVLLGMIIPILATVVLGRVFCSWICPIGFLLELTGKLRGVLSLIKIPPKHVVFWRGNKYVLLGAGLIVSALTGAAVSNEIYPPALFSREIHNAISFLFEQAENGFFGFTLNGLTGISILLALVIIIEVFVSQRMWCRYLCPGGALYSLLGYRRLIRVRRESAKCDSCAACIKACGMGLNPMKDSMGIECDNCWACVSSCGEDALAIQISPERWPSAGHKKILKNDGKTQKGHKSHHIRHGRQDDVGTLGRIKT